jgi:hypothetical protein
MMRGSDPSNATIDPGQCGSSRVQEGTMVPGRTVVP